MIILNFIRRKKPEVNAISITHIGQKAILWSLPEVDFEVVCISSENTLNGNYALTIEFIGRKVV